MDSALKITMNETVLHKTESVCPVCLKRIQADLVRQDSRVLLQKDCPEHGSFSTVVWNGEPSFSNWYRPKIPYYGGLREVLHKGCPFDCGLCEHHTQRTCTALVEITSRCNLNCPVCFADSGGYSIDPDIETIASMFDSIMHRTGGCNLQISGGEPTVRTDLAAIVERAVSSGFSFVQLNTNGIELADDPKLASRLGESGLSSVFLQFDGVNDTVYNAIRGKTLWKTKQRAIENLAVAGIGVVLVPTVVKGVNDHQLWDLVQFGLSNLPHIRGVHFQPMAYFGRYPSTFTPDHVTLPEIMSGLVRQSGEKLSVSDFTPPGCEHALCSFSARYILQENGELKKLGDLSTALQSCECQPQPAEQGALKSIAVTARQWGKFDAPVADQRIASNDLDRFLQRARTHTFAVSGMAFQDCWSMNIERLKGCCIHVAQPDGRLIPFCAFNLTATDGTSIHRSALLDFAKP